jgi:hypothetical protein
VFTSAAPELCRKETLLNRTGILVASLSFVLFAGSAQADAGSAAPADFDTNVQIVRDGTVIATVHMPPGGKLEFPGGTRGIQAFAKDGSRTMTFTNDAPFVATVVGQRFAMMQGDQVILIQTPVERTSVEK